MSSAVNVFAHAIRKCSKECLAQIVDNLGFPVTSPKKFQYNRVVFLYVFSEYSEVAKDHSQNIEQMCRF